MITIKLQGLNDARALLDPKIYKQAARSAISKITTQAKTEISEQIRQDQGYSIKKSDLDPYLRIKPPRTDDLQASISITSKPISLIYFDAKQLTAQNRIITRTMGRQLKRKSRTLQQGVSYQIMKGQRERLPHAFMAYDPRLQRMVVWYRTSKERGSVKTVNFVTLSTLTANKSTLAAINNLVNAKFKTIFDHELEYFMARAKK